MTNHWIDYQHSDVMLQFGGNTAENHPISMKWIQRAMDNGCKLIVVDPRFTRTAALADVYAPIRPGTNTAFLSGLINYAIENNKYHADYVKMYTNASSLINPDFGYSDGLFTGSSPAANLGAGQVAYTNKDSWSYQRDGEGNILKDETLENENCVWQLFKNHYSRYDVKTVSEITGCPEDKFREVAELFCSTGVPGKAGNFMYAMGLTQFSHGSQNTRSACILQLLLGNIGIAGGGVNAQRGQVNVQGACDMGMLYHIITGYMPMPRDGQDLEAYNAATPGGFWQHRPKFLAAMLKAWYGDKATEENDFCFDYLARLEKDRSSVAYYTYMAKGEIKGLFCFGDNPVVGGANTIRKRKAQAKLDWMVVADIYENETAAFFNAPDMNAAEIDTEVFLLPASLHFEKDGGTVTNSGRWIQWRNKAQDAPGDCKSDLWIVDKIFKAVKKLYEDEGGAYPGPIVDMVWDYGDEPDYEKVAMEINGYYVADGKQITGFADFVNTEPGDVAAGSWIYAGFYQDAENPNCKRRIKETEGIGSNLEYSWAWPMNRRIVYNRASCDAEGNPWNPDIPVLQWDGSEWKLNDVPDFNASVPPEDTASKGFIMTAELQSRLFAPGMVEGPFPEFYEPWESVTSNKMSSVQFNPCSQVWYPEDRGSAADYPYIATTYRLVEHYQSGIMTRNMPWLNEVMPEMFCEISPSLASTIGVENGDMVEVESKRGKIECKVAVTPRVKPLMINGEEKEIVGLPFHWGFKGLSTGASANDLSPTIGCANTTIPEFKSFICNIRRAG